MAGQATPEASGLRVRKNSFEEIRITPVRFKGYELVDLRVWTLGVDGREPQRTRKGATFGQDLLPDVIAALQALDAEIHGAAQE